ncbi:MAG: hypothetical protein RIS45_11, partial [Planctomycetota bacterium]
EHGLGGMQDAYAAGLPVALLPVGYDDIVVPLARCTGHCCAGVSFSVPSGHLNAADLRRAGRYHRDLTYGKRRNGWRLAAGQLVQMLIPEIGRIAQLFRPTIVQEMRSGGRLQMFACKKLSACGDCEIYDKRPKLCRDHGMHNVCDLGACRMRVQVNPLVHVPGAT